MQPACLERLYLPRNELGRGLASVEHRSEQMLLQMHHTLAKRAPLSTRCSAILKVERESKTHLGTIVEFLRAKYKLGDECEITPEQLTEAQRSAL
ncbi:hypothetical protein PAPHI01_2636, partial [Pancytospora philotis]